MDNDSEPVNKKPQIESPQRSDIIIQEEVEEVEEQEISP